MSELSLRAYISCNSKHKLLQKLNLSTYFFQPRVMTIDLLCIVDSQPSVHTLITNVFMEAVMLSLEEMVC